MTITKTSIKAFIVIPINLAREKSMSTWDRENKKQKERERWKHIIRTLNLLSDVNKNKQNQRRTQDFVGDWVLLLAAYLSRFTHFQYENLKEYTLFFKNTMKFIFYILYSAMCSSFLLSLLFWWTIVHFDFVTNKIVIQQLVSP